MSKVICRIYNENKEFSNIQEAKDFFLEGINCSQGSEQQRYTTIYCQLSEGRTYCTDEELY